VREGDTPGFVVLAGGWAVEDPESVPVFAQFGGRDMGIGLCSSESAKPFMYV
jgi:hypothetical protein